MKLKYAYSKIYSKVKNTDKTDILFMRYLLTHIIYKELKQVISICAVFVINPQN